MFTDKKYCFTGILHCVSIKWTIDQQIYTVIQGNLLFNSRITVLLKYAMLISQTNYRSVKIYQLLVIPPFPSKNIHFLVQCGHCSVGFTYYLSINSLFARNIWLFSSKNLLFTSKNILSQSKAYFWLVKFIIVRILLWFFQ